MARRQLDAVLHYLGRPWQQRTMAPLSDGQLLDRFLHERDEVAFAEIVHRHAALVLGTAAGVLRDAHEAEDVFQATFLVLARKAGSIRQRAALAGWLYQTASHLALRVRAANGKRRVHERQVEAMVTPPPDALVRESESRAVLTEELGRLPEKYRAPLVLHNLEGHSKSETARQLGWSAGTVSGRLDRARRLLQRRLVRRGFVLAAAGLATFLAESTARAAVSPRLIESIARAALAVARGITPGAAVSAAALSLAEAMMGRVFLANVRTALLVLAVSALVAGVTGYAALSGRAGGDEQGRSAPEVSRAAPAQPGQEPRPAPSGDAPVHLAASGKVVDERGNPVVGATVLLREIAVLRDTATLQKPGYTDILARTVTEAGGKFSFQEVVTDSALLSRGGIYKHPWNVVAMAPGRGAAWHIFQSCSEDDLTLTLGPEASLRGRLLDGGGRPAAGVRVRVIAIDHQIDPDVRGRTFPERHLSLWWSRLPLAALTDADGRFLLEGLPRESHVSLQADDPRFARTYYSCATIDNATLERLNARDSAPAQERLFPNGFTATLEPNGSILGRVLYADTGGPAAGLRVSAGMFATFTDADGRYRLDGFRALKWPLAVDLPEGADYLGEHTEVEIGTDTRKIHHDFTLRRGAVLTGRLREKESGQPIAVPGVTVAYRTTEAQSASSSAHTREGGSFRLVVPPGKGRLILVGHVPGYVPPYLLDDDPRLEVAEPVEIRPGETLAGKDILVVRGLVVEGRVLDPKGRPVAGATFHGITEHPPSAADGNFCLRGLSPRFKSHFVVVQPARGLGTELTIEPLPGPDPVVLVVTLQPTQSAVVRVRDESGQPVANAHVQLLTNIRSNERANGFSDGSLRAQGPARTDAAGRATLGTLAVGGSYTVTASAPGYTQVQNDFRVEDGRKPDVPDLVLLANQLTLGGVVVDGAGNPLEGVQVRIQPRNAALLQSSLHSVQTGKDGRFHFGSLPKGEYRLLANLWKPTGKRDDNGQPVQRREAGVDLRFQAGSENLRIVLDVRRPGGQGP